MALGAQIPLKQTLEAALLPAPVCSGKQWLVLALPQAAEATRALCLKSAALWETETRVAADTSRGGGC